MKKASQPELTALTHEISFPRPVQGHLLSSALYRVIARQQEFGLTDGEINTDDDGLRAFMIDDTSGFITVEGDCTRLTIHVEPATTDKPRNGHAIKKLNERINQLMKVITRALQQAGKTPLPT